MKNCLMMPNIGIWEMRITVPYENIADLLYEWKKDFEWLNSNNMQNNSNR